MDASQSVDEQVREFLESLQLAFEMWESTCGKLTKVLSAEHPEWSAEEVQREVVRRMAHGEIP